MWLSVVAIILLAVLAYFRAFALIEDMKELFLKAGMFGKDLNKNDDSQIPESLGVVSAAVFFIVMFLFMIIPFPFLDNLINPANTEYIQSPHPLPTPSLPSPPPHHLFHFFVSSTLPCPSPASPCPSSQFILYLCAALLSVCCMTFLGFADDVLNLRWRHKLLLPTVASLPLLMIYFVSGGSTTVILPTIVRPLLGRTLYLGPLYYVYMSMLAVFCTNSINILAGINGVEVGQSIVIAASVTLYVTIELVKGICCHQQYLLSLCILLPFLGVASALYRHNKYPSKVFVGDTFCYFAGVVLAVSGILGLFSEILLLFFIPQVLNFVYSTPQLFGLIPCPRHRLPRFNHNTGLLEMSRTTFVVTDLPPLGQTVFKLLKLFRLIDVKREGTEGMVSINNLTIINFVLKLRGPTHERTLTNYILVIQVFGSVVAFTIRYGLTAIFYLPPV